MVKVLSGSSLKRKLKTNLATLTVGSKKTANLQNQISLLFNTM